LWVWAQPERLAKALASGVDAVIVDLAQVAAVHLAMAPVPAQLDWSARVLAAAAQAGQGAVLVDGKMVDAPVIRLARQLQARQAAA
jgi:citrate lyase beta subunit